MPSPPAALRDPQRDASEPLADPALRSASARHRSLAAPLLLLYAALIIYASLSPFTGWKAPSGLRWWGLGHVPWPRYWIPFDVVSNLLGYVPLGGLMFVALVRSGWRAVGAAVIAVILGVLLSLTMESLQNHLPQRVPSSLDWALNSGGTLIGVLLAWAVHALGGVHRWQLVRERWFIPRSAGGLVLLLLWPIALLFPTPVPMGLGQVLDRLQSWVGETLQDTPWSDWVAGWTGNVPSMDPLARGTEMVAVALGLLAPCLIAFTVARPGWRRVVLAGIGVALGLATTTLSTALNFGPQHALTWVTPAVLPATALALLLGLLLAFLPRRAAAGVGLVVLTALVALVDQAPADPYYAESLHAWEQGRFIRFHGLAQWVGWVWPYVAMAYLLMRLGSGDTHQAPPA